MQEGHPVAFESRKLNAAEQRYSAHENEMTTVIHCVESGGAHSFRLRVRQGPTPPTGTSTPGPSSAAAGPSATTGPSAAAAGASPSVLVVRPSVATALAAPLLYRALLLLMLRVPPLWPLPIGDIIPGLAPLHPLLHIPGQPGGPHRSTRLGHQVYGSHPLRDSGRHPHHLIRVLPELQTYLRHPSSGGLTSPTTLSRGMLTIGGEISMGRCTMIFRHLQQTRGSETPYSSFRDIWSRSWCRVDSIILSWSSSSFIR